jgi:bacillithiol system protein YtxJ
MTDHAATTTRFVPVPNLDAFDDLLPRAGVVVLFLHAPRCGISVRAYAEVARLGGDVALVDVSRHHHVKWAIEERTEVRHESPQVIVLHGGQVIWSASHRAITATAVRRACRAVGDERSPQG